MPSKLPVPKGKRYSSWIVLSDGQKSGYWSCRCVCGCVRDVRPDTLKNDQSTNCGCIKRKNWIERNTKYKNGETEDQPFYRRWQEMRIRCYSGRYPIYNKKGIKVCPRWMDEKLGFINFRKDMYESYLVHLKQHGLNETTLDRINNDGDYEPSNCRWATRATQIKNSDRWKNK